MTLVGECAQEVLRPSLLYLCIKLEVSVCQLFNSIKFSFIYIAPFVQTAIQGALQQQFKLR